VDDRLVREHERSASKLNPKAIIRVHGSKQRLVKSSHGFVDGASHPETATAGHRKIWWIPQFLKTIFLRMAYPFLIELRDVDTTGNEVVKRQRAVHRRQPIRPNLVVRVAERQGGGDGVPSPDIPCVRGPGVVRGVDDP
jgi:hypothetical protein